MLCETESTDVLWPTGRCGPLSAPPDLFQTAQAPALGPGQCVAMFGLSFSLLSWLHFIQSVTSQHANCYQLPCLCIGLVCDPYGCFLVSHWHIGHASRQSPFLCLSFIFGSEVNGATSKSTGPG